MKPLKPFWCYYGGKSRAAKLYPAPRHATIIEPFAGAAGYSLRYPALRVILVEKYPLVAEIWRYLISTHESDIRRVPAVKHVDDLPDWVPDGARSLVGFWLNFATTSPRKSMSATVARGIQNTKGGGISHWVNTRERIASQVGAIRHWQIIEGDWYSAPMIEATWFVDPPYNNKAGAHYIHGPEAIDYDLLGDACRRLMPGHVIACENAGADWLPFSTLATTHAGQNSPGNGSKEVMWTR